MGLAALLNSLWLLLLLVPATIAAHYILILPEEQYLKSKFGEPYRQYVHSVRRWIGKCNGDGVSTHTPPN